MSVPVAIFVLLFINGICINTIASPELIERVDEISKMFPNAVIFNENKEILHYPLINKIHKTK